RGVRRVSLAVLGHLRPGRGRLVGRRAPCAAAPPAAATATGTARTAAARPTPPTHRAEALAVGLATAAALPGGGKPLGGAASPAGLVLVAEARVLLGETLVALGHDLALVDPDLHADPAEGRLRLTGAVVDVRTDRVQRDTALRGALDAAHPAAAEAAGALDLHAVGAGAHRRGERALHRPPEAHTVLELLGDRLRDQLGVEFGALVLVDVDVDVLVRHRVNVLAQRVDLDARLP